MKIGFSIKSFFCFLMGFSFLFWGIASIVFFQESKAQKRILLAEERQNIEKLLRIANDDVQSVTADLFFLSVHPMLHQILENDSPIFRQKLADDFKLFSSRSMLYDQIRFLDETGMERIRINFNGSQPVIVSEVNLQNKGNRYYFADTFALEPGHIFVSPFDLNIEQGQIEYPLKPVIRFGTPVVDRTGEKRGIVLLNYLGAKLTDDLKQALPDPKDSFMLLNADGYWLKGQHSKDEWGFMYENRKDRTFAKRCPDAWEKILTRNEGQFDSNLGVYTFTTIRPLGNGMLSSTGSAAAFQSSNTPLSKENFYWKVVSLITKDKLKALKTELFFNWLPYLGGLLIITILLSLAFCLALSHRGQAAEERVKKEKLQGVLEMAGAVSHELNQPLMCISGFSELLMEDLPDDHIQRANLFEIKKQAEHLGDITNRLMTITTYKTKKYLNGDIIDIEAASDD